MRYSKYSYLHRNGGHAGIVKVVFWFAAGVSHHGVLHPPMVFFVDEIPGTHIQQVKKMVTLSGDPFCESGFYEPVDNPQQETDDED